MKTKTWFSLALILLLSISLSQVQAQTFQDHGITNEVCIFVDVDNPVSENEKELIYQIQEIFCKGGVVSVLVRFEGLVRLEFKNFLKPFSGERDKIFVSCTHKGAKIVISSLTAKNATLQGRLPKATKSAAVTYRFPDYSDFTIIYQSEIFDESVLHEWGHQVIRDSYKNSIDPLHSINKRSRMYKESVKGVFNREQIWTPEDIQLIKERIRS